MRPKERQESGQNDLFRAWLDQIVDVGHPLVKLGKAIDWRFLEDRFGAACSARAGHPPLPTRLMAGLAIVKSMHDLSDEDLCALDREPVLSAVLRRGVLPAQDAVRPLVTCSLVSRLLIGLGTRVRRGRRLVLGLLSPRLGLVVMVPRFDGHGGYAASLSACSGVL